MGHVRGCCARFRKQLPTAPVVAWIDPRCTARLINLLGHPREAGKDHRPDAGEWEDGGALFTPTGDVERALQRVRCPAHLSRPRTPGCRPTFAAGHPFHQPPRSHRWLTRTVGCSENLRPPAGPEQRGTSRGIRWRSYGVRLTGAPASPVVSTSRPVVVRGPRYDGPI